MAGGIGRQVDGNVDDVIADAQTALESLTLKESKKKQIAAKKPCRSLQSAKTAAARSTRKVRRRRISDGDEEDEDCSDDYAENIASNRL